MTDTIHPLGVAVVGCGRISFSHLRAITAQPQLGTLVAVVDVDRGLAEETAHRHGARFAFGSLDEALACKDVEAVDLCLPSFAHADATVIALKAGKHVLVEKPMADDAAAAARMVEAAKASGRILAVAQSKRQLAAIRYIQDNLASFGSLMTVEASFCVRWNGPQAPWWGTRRREQGLALALIGPHVLDFVQMVMGAMPHRVYAESVRRQSSWLADDEVTIMLAYPERRLATVHLSYNQDPPLIRKTLFFEGAIVVVDNDRDVQINGEMVLQVDPAEAHHALDGAIEFHRQFEEFVKAVRGQPNRCVFGQEGLQLMRVLEAAQRSTMTTQPEYLV